MCGLCLRLCYHTSLVCGSFVTARSDKEEMFLSKLPSFLALDVSYENSAIYQLNKYVCGRWN